MICDFAETYHVFDYRALSPSKAAVLACGLREDSRIKMITSGAKLPLNTVLALAICDDLRWIRWTKTESARHNMNMPKSLLNEILYGETDDHTSFSSPEEFERRRAEIIGG